MGTEPQLTLEREERSDSRMEKVRRVAGVILSVLQYAAVVFYVIFAEPCFRLTLTGSGGWGAALGLIVLIPMMVICGIASLILQLLACTSLLWAVRGGVRRYIVLFTIDCVMSIAVVASFLVFCLI